jgi:hypothetical protein
MRFSVFSSFLQKLAFQRTINQLKNLSFIPAFSFSDFQLKKIGSGKKYGLSLSHLFIHRWCSLLDRCLSIINTGPYKFPSIYICFFILTVTHMALCLTLSLYLSPPVSLSTKPFNCIYLVLYFREREKRSLACSNLPIPRPKWEHRNIRRRGIVVKRR